jgi:hypothetical protein
VTSAELDLKHLPDEYELPKARAKIVVLMGLSLVFILGGVVISARDLRAGLFVSLLFGLFLLAFVLLIIGGSRVVLERNGFEVRHLFRSQRYNWRDVSEFTHARVGRSHMILFNDVTRADKAGGFFRRFLRSHNSGFPAGLLAGPLDDVCARMNAFRARALRKP